MNPLWVIQALAVVRLEMKKTFFSRRGFWIYILAFAPAAVFATHSILRMSGQIRCDFGSRHQRLRDGVPVFLLCGWRCFLAALEFS